MTAFGILYSPVPSARIFKVTFKPTRVSSSVHDISETSQILAAARINNLQIDVPKSPEFVFRETNKSPAYLARFPLGKIPALALPDGSSIWESDAIAQFVAESGPNSAQLLGATALQRAHIRQWISFAPDNIFTPVWQMAMWRVGMAAYEEEKEANAMATLEKTLGVLEGALNGTSGWLVECPEGRLSLADLSVASYLLFGFQFVIDKEMRRKYPKTAEWYLRVVTDPTVGDAFGEPQMIEERKVGGT